MLKQSRKFLLCARSNFWIQMVKRPNMMESLFDLLLMNREKLINNVKVEGNLGDSDQEMLEFKFLRGERKDRVRIKRLDLRKSNFKKFRELVGRIPKR